MVRNEPSGIQIKPYRALWVRARVSVVNIFWVVVALKQDWFLWNNPHFLSSHA